MEATSSDKKSFQLKDNDELLGTLIYENLFFSKARIQLSNEAIYEIAPVGFFGTRIAVTNNGVECAHLSMSWNGKIIISLEDNREYALKLKGLFHNKMILENKDNESILQFEPKFNWKMFQYNYNISYDISNESESKDYLLLLLGVYAANYFIATISGANAGMM